MDEKSPVVRRPIASDLASGDFNTQLIMHTLNYTKCVDLMVGHSRNIGRPLDVLDLGCGDMWPLRVLWNGSYVKKSTILRTYLGMDIANLSIPVGSQTNGVELKFLQRDFMKDYSMPIESADFVIMLEFIEHIDNYSAMQVLSNVVACIRPGGKLYLSTPNANVHKDEKYHLYQYTLEEIIGELTVRGMQIDFILGQYASQNALSKCLQSSDLMHPTALAMLKNRLSTNYYRCVLATLFPEASEGITLYASKVGDV